MSLKEQIRCKIESIMSFSLTELEVIRTALFTASYNRTHENSEIPYIPHSDEDYAALRTALKKVDNSVERLRNALAEKEW